MLFNAVASLMTLFVIASMGVQPAQATIIAYSGTACDGSAGLDVPCDGSCHSFDTRHSFVSAPDVQLTSELPNSHWYDMTESGKRRSTLRHHVRESRLSCRGSVQDIHIHGAEWAVHPCQHWNAD